MTNYQVIQGDVFATLPTIKPKSVNTSVSSPPYWMLRSYLPAFSELKKFELGREPTPELFIENMVRVYSLVRDTLADHGTCFINMGDTYGAGQRHGNRNGTKQASNVGTIGHDERAGFDSGSMALIPQRLAIALQEDGWIVRSIIVWHKPAPMPASLAGWRYEKCRVKVKTGQYGTGDYSGATGDPEGHANSEGRNGDSSVKTQWANCPGCKKCEKTGGLVLRRGSWRPTSSWEPIIMLAKSKSYFCDGEATKTAAAAATISRNQYTRILEDPDEQFAVAHDHETLGTTANLRDVWRTPLEEMSKEELIDIIQALKSHEQPDVWTIAAEPLKEKHYAAYPTSLVEKCLRSATSAHGYCPGCGMPWVRIVESVDSGQTQKAGDNWDTSVGDGGHGSHNREGRSKGETNVPVMISKTTGWKPTCSCQPAEPRPGVVLDPFCGSGRTGITARRMGLDFIGCELNPDFVTMSKRLMNADAPLFS